MWGWWKQFSKSLNVMSFFNTLNCWIILLCFCIFFYHINIKVKKALMGNKARFLCAVLKTKKKQEYDWCQWDRTKDITAWVVWHCTWYHWTGESVMWKGGIKAHIYKGLIRWHKNSWSFKGYYNAVCTFSKPLKSFSCVAPFHVSRKHTFLW